MRISQQMAAMTYSLKQAINTVALDKAMKQDVTSIANVLEMANDLSKVTGVGSKLDLKV